ncbi:uncharacterized protein ACRADG_012271 isoform 2-T5 [Cochliomyia hominivorax]
MNVTLTSQQIKSENTEISSENEKLTDDDEGENDNKSNIEFNYKYLKVGDDNDDDDDDEVNKVQNSETTMPQDLRKCDKISKHNKQSDFNVENSNLERSSKSPWQHCDGGYIDEDVYTISAAGQTLPNSSLQITSIDGFFNRKRGRPPKNRFVEVYKNTHQKPQAIFTSFKLEKHEKSDTATNYESSLNYCLQSGEVTATGSDNDEIPMKHPRHKPNINSTHRKRLNKVNLRNMILSTISGQNNALEEVSKEPHLSREESNDDNDINYAKNYNLHKGSNLLNEHFKSPNSFENGDCDDNDNSKSISSDLMPAAKKRKLCGATDHVTVVRAAGTYYPENSHEDCKVNNNHKEKMSDDNNGREGDIVLGKEELKSSSALYKDNNMAQNLSLKDSVQFNTDSLETPTLPLLTASPSVLPQIYSVLQMQQQLFAFYHQMALMTPAISQLDLKSLFIPTLTQTTVTALSSPSSSTSSMTLGESDLPFHNNKDLVNMILSLKRQQLNQKNVSDDLQNVTSSLGRVRPLHKRAMNSTITSGTGRGNIMHTHNITEEAQDISHTITPAEKLPEAQFSHAKRTPSGYLRFRFNEDCGYNKCGYRQHQSHFHCNRADCQYSFCDKTRFVQHTARHERLDTLMGSDFQQYRATMTCNYSNCPYAFNSTTEDSNDILNGRKSSHFHCLKCPFVCVDTNKVVAHRRLHNKMEYIRLAGFRKVASNENCMYSCSPSSSKALDSNDNISLDIEISESDKNLAVQNDTVINNHLTTDNDLHCPYAMRHAHYHCLTCNCSVLSRSQLLAHKHRNVGILHTPQPSESATLLSSKDKNN